MELAAVFLLPLLGGYVFASLWRLTSYATRRVEGHHLYFSAAFYGAVFFIAALLVRVIFLARWDGYSELEAALSTYIAPAMKDPSNGRQVEFVITAGYSLLLAPLFAALLNIFTPKRWSLRRNLSALDGLLSRAQYAEMPVSVTLNTGKVYIGLVVEITDPDRPPPAIILFPMLSGHRDADGRLKITTDYANVYSALEANKEKVAKLLLPAVWEPNFEVVVRADQIVSANMFSPGVYSEFNPGWRDSIRSASEPPPRQEVLVEIKSSPKKPWRR
jgi:hypothetical protein